MNSEENSQQPEHDHELPGVDEVIGAEDQQEVYEDNRIEGEDAPMEDADDEEEEDDDDPDLAQEQYGQTQEADSSTQLEGEGENQEFKDTSIAAFYSHRKSLFSLSLHPHFPSPPLALTGGEDENGWIWDTRDGADVFKLDGHTDSVTSVVWNSNGEMVATGGMDGRVRVWKKEDGSWSKWSLVIDLEGPDEVVWLTWHPTGNVLVAGASDSTVWMWHLPSGNVMNVFSGHTSPVTCGSFTPDGKKLLTASEDNSLILWDPRSTIPLAKLQSHDSRFRFGEGGITSLTISPDSKVCIVGGVSGEVRVVNIGNVENSGSMVVVASLEGHSRGESIESISFIDLLSPNTTESYTSNAISQSSSNNVITISTEGKGIVWDLSNQKMRCEIFHDAAITTLAVHKGSHLFSTSSSDHTVKTWDSRTGACLATHQGFTDGVLVVAVGRDDGFTQGKETGGVGAYVEEGKGLGWKVVGAGDEGVALVFRV